MWELLKKNVVAFVLGAFLLSTAFAAAPPEEKRWIPADWSPDGTEILAYLTSPNGSSLYRVNVASGETKVIVSYPGRESFVGASFSPDGKKVAFTTIEDNLPVINIYTVEGEELEKIFINEGEVLAFGHWPQWLLDGERLLVGAAFKDSAGNINCDLCVLTLEDKCFERLTQAQEVEWLPSISPDGSKIAYAKRVAPGHNQLCIIDLESRRVETLTQVPDVLHTSWSPDGNKIAFDTYGSGPGVWVTDSQVGAEPPKQITQDGRRPLWSPDGKRIAFQRELPRGSYSTKICIWGLEKEEVIWQWPAAAAEAADSEGDITEIDEQVFEKEAPEEAGSISGVISPPLLDLVVGATASDGRFSRMAKVDENSGEYIIKDLRPDTYSLAFISRGAFVLVGINLEVALSDLNDEVNAQISEVVDSFDRFFENGDIQNLNNLFAEEASKDKSRIIDTVHNTESRRISNKKIVVQKGDSSKVAIIRRVCLELKGQMNRKDIIGQEIHLKSIEGQWKITKMQTSGSYGPEWREPEPFVHPYTEYILDPNIARIDVTAGEEEKGHNYTLPPEAVKMSELKEELKLKQVPEPGGRLSGACRSYLKHIGLACSIYSNDYNGFFPPNFEALREGGYIVKESFPKLMKCPAQQEEYFETLQEKEEFDTLREKYPVQEEDVGYVYIGAGKRWEKETEELAAITIIAYDKRPAHDNGRNVLFMKGHVEWMPEEDFQKLLAEQRKK